MRDRQWLVEDTIELVDGQTQSSAIVFGLNLLRMIMPNNFTGRDTYFLSSLTLKPFSIPTRMKREM
jgi:hypothetical protein